MYSLVHFDSPLYWLTLVQHTHHTYIITQHLQQHIKSLQVGWVSVPEPSLSHTSTLATFSRPTFELLAGRRRWCCLIKRKEVSAVPSVWVLPRKTSEVSGIYTSRHHLNYSLPSTCRHTIDTIPERHLLVHTSQRLNLHSDILKPSKNPKDIKT